MPFDLTVKAGLYVRARILEYWVLDANERRLIVHRDPAAGEYQTITVYGEHESLSPLAATACRISSHRCIPPVASP